MISPLVVCCVHDPQSWLQLEHVSAPLHEASPQTGVSVHAPQSEGHDEHVSAPLQIASPHDDPITFSDVVSVSVPMLAEPISLIVKL